MGDSVHKLQLMTANLELIICLFVLRLNVSVNNFFSHVGMEPPLPGYYQYFRGVKCLAQGHSTVEVGFEPLTSFAPESDALPLSLRAPLGVNKNLITNNKFAVHVPQVVCKPFQNILVVFNVVVVFEKNNFIEWIIINKSTWKPFIPAIVRHLNSHFINIFFLKTDVSCKDAVMNQNEIL